MALTARKITARIPHQSQKWVPKCPFLCQLPPGGSQGRSRASACKQQFISPSPNGEFFIVKFVKIYYDMGKIFPANAIT